MREESDAVRKPSFNTKIEVTKKKEKNNSKKMKEWKKNKEKGEKERSKKIK